MMARAGAAAGFNIIIVRLATTALTTTATGKIGQRNISLTALKKVRHPNATLMKDPAGGI
jgi:hypothetical protein